MEDDSGAEVCDIRVMEFTEAWDDTCSSVGLVARGGKLKDLRRLIRSGYPVDAADNRGWRPLHEAAAIPKDLGCLEELLNHDKTNVNWQTHEGETALLLSCKRRHDNNADQAVQLLLQHGADANIADNEEETPLLAATRAVQTNVVEHLVKTGYADTNMGDCSGWRPLHEAATHGHRGMLLCLLAAAARIDVQDECGMTPIFTAAQHGRVDCLRELLQVAEERGQIKLVNKGAEDWATPLMIAAQQGFTDCVKILLNFGANPNLQTLDNVTALHLAVQGEHVECLQLLLEKMELKPLIEACQPSQLTNMRPGQELDVISPLHLAVEWRSHRCLQMLLDSGFPADSLYERSPLPLEHRLSLLPLPLYETALTYAVHKKDIDAVAILLRAGASCNAFGSQVLHPLYPAIFNPTMKELDFLVEHGCNVNYHRDNLPSNECLLMAFANSEALMGLLLHGSDPSLCFQDGNENSLNIFLNCLFSTTDQQVNILNILQIILQFTLITKAVRTAFHAATAKAREVFHATFDEESWHSLLKEVDCPSRLKNSCRIKIRQHLKLLHGTISKTVIHHLFLPSTLTQYLMYSDPG